jgi:hypothetical protein
MVKALLESKHIGDRCGTRSIGKMVHFNSPLADGSPNYCFCVMGAIIVGVGYAKVDIDKERLVANVPREQRIGNVPWDGDIICLNEAVAVLRVTCWMPSDQMVPIATIAERILRGDFSCV